MGSYAVKVNVKGLSITINDDNSVDFDAFIIRVTEFEPTVRLIYIISPLTERSTSVLSLTASASLFTR